MFETLQRLLRLPSRAGKSSSTLRMRRDWDERARENPLFFIASGASSDLDSFFASGEGDLSDTLLSNVRLSKNANVLEIGCGMGRLTEPLSRTVRSVLGVDISPEMITLAKKYQASKNIRYLTTDGDLREVRDNSLDLVFSFIVFQHVPERTAIERYIAEADRCLRPGGVISFQLDGRVRERATRELSTYHGQIFSTEEATELFSGLSLRPVEVWGGGTHYLWLTGVKEGRDDAAVSPRLRITDRRLLTTVLKAVGANEEHATGSHAASIRTAANEATIFGKAATSAEIVCRSFEAILGRTPHEREMTHCVRILDEKLESPSDWLDTIFAGGELHGRLRPELRLPRALSPRRFLLRAQEVLGLSRTGSPLDVLDSIEEELYSVTGEALARIASDLAGCGSKSARVGGLVSGLPDSEANPVDVLQEALQSESLGT